MRATTGNARVWHRVRVAVAVATSVTPWGLALGQRRIDESSLVAVYHRSGKILTGARKDESVLADVNRFELRKGSKVKVVVADQNPALFTYDTTVTMTETDQHKIAAQFATTLGSVLKPFESRLGGGVADGTIEVEGLNFKELTADLTSLNLHLKEIRSQLALSLGDDDDVKKMKDAVSGWGVPALVTRLHQEYERVAVIASKCLARQPLGTSAGTSLSCGAPLENAGVAQTDRASAQPIIDAKPPAPVGTGRSEPIADAVKPPRPTGGKASTKTVVKQVNAPDLTKAAEPATPSGETIESFVTLAVALQTRVDQSADVLRGFAADVASINTPKVIADRPYDLKNQNVQLTIKASPKYDDFLDAGTKAKRDAAARKVSIVFEPYSPVSLGLAPAAVLLFIKNPTYSAAPAGGGYTIKSADEDATLYNLAAMLTITPRAWDEPTFGGSFELGISPTKDKIGLYAGAGISVQDLFLVGAGFAWQQVNQLAGGLAEGQPIASADALKTETKFKPGFYLHLTVK